MPTTDTTTGTPLREPIPPFPAQHQPNPGDESELDPAPRWKGERYRPSGKLEGLAAIVTGGDSGIGRAVAYHFAREGADVVISCLPEEQNDAAVVKQAIEELDRRCVIFTQDLRETAACDALVDTAMSEFGRLDTLVHNAAWQNRKPITDLDDSELDRTMKTNVYAYLRLARAAIPSMSAGSSIIATGSVVGLRGSDELSDYGATKGAIHSITKSLADELIDKHIRVNCVAPGPVWTPLNPSDRGVDAEEVAEFGGKVAGVAMGRPAQPEELAPAYVFFASNADSSFITGAVLPVTGQPV